jgi:hypothetical protein
MCKDYSSKDSPFNISRKFLSNFPEDQLLLIRFRVLFKISETYLETPEIWGEQEEAIRLGIISMEAAVLKRWEEKVTLQLGTKSLSIKRNEAQTHMIF